MQEGETARAYAAFGAYRDLGPERSLKKAAEIYYGSTANLRQLGVWSSRFKWVERARSYDDWMQMIAHSAVEEHLRTRAADFAARQAALKDTLLENAELAAEQERKMLEWPLVEQRVVRETEDGLQALVFMPAGWSKATARAMHDMAASAVVGAWSTAKPGEVSQDAASVDLSEWSDEDLHRYLELVRRARPGSYSRSRPRGAA